MNLVWTPSEFLSLAPVQAGQKARFLDPHFGAKIAQNRKKKRPKKHACFGTLPEGHQTRSGSPNPPQKHAKTPFKASPNAKNPQPRKPWFFLGKVKVFEGSDPPKSSQKCLKSSSKTKLGKAKLPKPTFLVFRPILDPPGSPKTSPKSPRSRFKKPRKKKQVHTANLEIFYAWGKGQPEGLGGYASKQHISSASASYAAASSAADSDWQSQWPPRPCSLSIPLVGSTPIICSFRLVDFG